MVFEGRGAAAWPPETNYRRIAPGAPARGESGRDAHARISDTLPAQTAKSHVAAMHSPTAAELRAPKMTKGRSRDRPFRINPGAMHPLYWGGGLSGDCGQIVAKSMSLFNSPPWAAALDPQIAAALVRAFSEPRLSRYYGYKAALQNGEHAIALHARNIVLSEALYPTFHLLEVIVRNSMHRAFCATFGVPNWYDGAWLVRSDRDMVNAAKAGLFRIHRPSTPDNVIAALTFGFWCAMLDRRYETSGALWPQNIKAIAPSAPAPCRNRKKIAERLEKARRLRNRIFHHEPIAHWQDLPMQRRDIVELIGWLSPAARRHAQALCRFPGVLAAQLRLAVTP